MLSVALPTPEPGVTSKVAGYASGAPTPLSFQLPYAEFFDKSRVGVRRRLSLVSLAFNELPSELHGWVNGKERKECKNASGYMMNDARFMTVSRCLTLFVRHRLDYCGGLDEHGRMRVNQLLTMQNPRGRWHQPMSKAEIGFVVAWQAWIDKSTARCGRFALWFPIKAEGVATEALDFTHISCFQGHTTAFGSPGKPGFSRALMPIR